MGVFAVDTFDLADIEWSPDDSAIVIWDSPLDYKVLIYSPDGRYLSKYQAYKSGLGVKTVTWSSCGQYLAVGSYDQMLRIFDHLTWKIFAEFMHLSTVCSPCSTAGFKKVDEPLQLDMSGLSLSNGFMQGNSENSPEGHSRVRYKVLKERHGMSGQVKVFKPDSTLATVRRGCLSLPEIASFYAMAHKPSQKCIYDPETVKFMLEISYMD
ncbi:hypothetical protein GIB67_036210 [Kingdonia uniflora]|uniref:ATXR3 C-terminal domain-containing protein n=1 Tax=Kingdonia uniflora TaxID=39325 RepID=A0A7J7L4U6_9MAGN|nr:hypothetical protein GIB67_036210 [Kingdonia uniflora]